MHNTAACNAIILTNIVSLFTQEELSSKDPYQRGRQDFQLHVFRLRQAVRQVQSLEGSHEKAHRREAFRLQLGRLRLEILAVRRTGKTQTISQRGQTVPVRVCVLF